MKENFRNLNFKLNSNTNEYRSIQQNEHIVTYIINISFLMTNTFLHLMNSNGNLLFFCSAGSLNYKGKQKKLRFLVFQSLFHILVSKFKFLVKKPIALHFKNVDSNKLWIMKKLNKKFFIKAVKSFNLHPYNGCRKKKIRRKKFKVKFWRNG